MASGKIARRTAVGDVGEILDSPEITALIAELDALRDTRGNKGYGTRALVGACLIKALFNLATWTWTVALIAEHPGLQEILGCEPIIPLRGAKKNQTALPLALGGRLFPRIARHTQRWKNLYRGRAAVEREFGRLKHEYGLAPLRVRGLERVALHADLTMLARLSQVLIRSRAIALAA